MEVRARDNAAAAATPALQGETAGLRDVHASFLAIEPHGGGLFKTGSLSGAFGAGGKGHDVRCDGFGTLLLAIRAGRRLAWIRKGRKTRVKERGKRGKGT
jgi:hypothetical protein